MVEYGNPVFASVMASSPEIATTHGVVRGINRNGIAVFRGIPYGADTATRRFLPPEKPAKWDGVLDCTKNGDICPQFGSSININADEGAHFSGAHPERFGAETEVMSENCLVLNVITPGIDARKRPVLFYIHGGGFAEGTGTLAIGSDDFCNEQDAVVVSINHRINIFGYLYLGGFDKKYESSGLAGMFDIILALKWVRDNIASFGGDPANVTIMGESGGGGKVSTLLAMDCAKGLFRNAVVESGSFPIATVSREQGTKMVKNLLRANGYSPDDWKVLLSKTSDEILGMMKTASVGFGFSPIADEIFLKYNFDGGYHAPETDEDVNLVIGCSEDELAGKRKMETYNLTDKTLRDALLAPFEAFGRPTDHGLCDEKNIDRVMDVIGRTGKPTEDANHKFSRVLSIATFGGTVDQLRCEASNPNRKKPVFAYLCAYDSQHPMYPNVKSMKYSWHTADLPYQLRIVLHPEADGISKIMSAAMGAFLRTGNPSTPEYPWPEFTASDRKTFVFDDECHIQSDPLGELYEVYYHSASPVKPL